MSIDRLMMLCLHGSNWSGVTGGGFGRTPAWCDVAGALRGMDAPCVDMAMYLCLGDAVARARLCSAAVAAMAKHGKVSVTEFSGVLTGLAEAALAEMLSPEICRECSGSGQVYNSSKSLRVCAQRPELRALESVGAGSGTCPTCSGRRVMQWSARKVAGMAGLDDRTYKRRWAVIYAAGCRAICVWLAGLSDHLRAQLSISVDRET